MTDSDVITETWKPVPGAGYYEVSDQAHDVYGVRSVDRTIDRRFQKGQLLTGKKTGTSRYWRLKIKGDDGRDWYATIHSLVLLAHVGPCPEGMQACHADDNPDNNRLPNLRWDWPRANVDDRMRNNPAAAKPKRGCILCGAEIATGRRCEDCRMGLGVSAAELLWNGVRLSKACEQLDYASMDGLHELARKYGGYGQRPEQSAAGVVTQRHGQPFARRSRRVINPLRWFLWK